MKKRLLCILVTLTMLVMAFVGCEAQEEASEPISENGESNYVETMTQNNESEHAECKHIWNEATCTTPKTCSVCGKTEGEVTHKYDAGVITTEATCENPGTKTYTCTICGDTRQESILRLGHKADSNNVCQRCGKECPIELNMTSDEKSNANRVNYISQRQVWHQDDEGRYVLVFSLLDSQENELSAPAIVDITIKNDEGETVYSSTRIVKTSDYTTWSYNNGAVKKYQATIYIDDEDISNGTTDSGDIYFTVYNTGYFSFDESQLSIDNLPLTPTTIILPELPSTIYEYGWDGDISCGVKITEITYEISNDDLYVFFTGEKTYDAEGSKYSQSCSVGWKLYDSEGYIVDDGTFYSPSIAVGEKFRNEKEYVWDVIIPGETYKLVISSVD